MNEYLFIEAEHDFLFLPSKSDIYTHTHTPPSAKDTDPRNLGVSLRVLGPSYLIWFSSLSFCQLSAAGHVGLESGCTSQLMLRDRRRENKNCLALVSSKVIYFQKLTESHCRGFIYFYSECHYSVMQGTWAHVGADSHKLECGRRLLMCRLSLGGGDREGFVGPGRA